MANVECIFERLEQNLNERLCEGILFDNSADISRLENERLGGYWRDTSTPYAALALNVLGLIRELMPEKSYDTADSISTITSQPLGNGLDNGVYVLGKLLNICATTIVKDGVKNGKQISCEDVARTCLDSYSFAVLPFANVDNATNKVLEIAYSIQFKSSIYRPDEFAEKLGIPSKDSFVVVKKGEKGRPVVEPVKYPDFESYDFTILRNEMDPDSSELKRGSCEAISSRTKNSRHNLLMTLWSLCVDQAYADPLLFDTTIQRYYLASPK